MQKETKNLAIMFTDVKGFTATTSVASRRQLDHILDLQDKVVRPVIKMFKGTVIKTIGDAFMVTFESPTNAVLCGMKIQEAVFANNATSPEEDHFKLRIAVNSGEVTVRDGDVFGEPVNIASRIESIADPGDVFFTESVFLAMNKNEIPTAEVGSRYLKGIPDRIKVYKVLKETTAIINTKKERADKAKQNANLSKSSDNLYSGNNSSSDIPILPKNKFKSFLEKSLKYWPIALIIILTILVILIVIIILRKPDPENIPFPQINQQPIGAPQQALEACTNLNEGESCSFNNAQEEIEGICKMVNGKDLECYSENNLNSDNSSEE